jgi:tryptophanyl-tRNA synthetase
LKGQLAEATVEFLRPIQQRVRGISDDQLNQILEVGRDKASKIAATTLKQVFSNLGITGAAK